jgi:hypothetical protein
MRTVLLLVAALSLAGCGATAGYGQFSGGEEHYGQGLGAHGNAGPHADFSGYSPGFHFDF